MMIGGLGRWGRVGSQPARAPLFVNSRLVGLWLQWMLELKLDFEHALLQA